MSVERILVIDDEPSLVRLCQRTLEKDGFEVKGALSGEEGLQLLKEQGFDLTLLDVRLPDCDGLDVLSTIREMDPEMAVVIVTGYGTMEAAIRALKSGAQDFLLKPFTPEELVASAQKVLEKERLIQENLRLKARLPILEISKALVAEVNLERLAQLALETVQQELGADRVSLMLMDEEQEELSISAALGLSDEVVATTRVKVGQGLAGLAAQMRQPLLLSDQAESDPAIQALLTRGDAGSAICVPLMLKDRVLGVLNANRPVGGAPFRQDDVDLLSILGGQIAVAIENARLFEQAQEEIAERKRAEEALREEKDKAQRYLDVAEVMLVAINGRGEVILMNQKGCRVLGYAEEEVIGRNWFDVFLPANVREEVRAVFHRLMAGEIEPLEYYENPIVTKSGEGRLIAWHNTVLTDEAGHIIGTLSSGEDITERKRMEEEIRRRNEELMALNVIAATLGQSLDLYHILDATLDKVLEVIGIDGGWIQLLDEDAGVLSLVTYRGLSQEMTEETKTIPLSESMTGPGRFAVKVAQSGQPITVDKVSDAFRLSPALSEAERMDADGAEALHAFTAVPIKSKDKVLGVLGVFSHSPRQRFAVDSQEVQLLTAIGHQIGVAIENVRLAEEASEIEILQELNRLRSELIANVSHELRTPLGLIKIFCSSLLVDDIDFDHETQLTFLRHIDEEADRLETIVDNLLDLSWVESGRLRLDKRPTDVGQLAREVIEAIKLEMDVPTLHASCSMLHDFPSDPLMAVVDPKRIEQVLRNLLSNAIKYSPEGGTITVQGRGDKRQLLILVSDQGIGIPSGDLERVFERFYRVENEITQSVRGAGLGLAVCRGIVEAHGGRIWVESTVGVGSTFYFTLPVLSKAEGPAGAELEKRSEISRTFEI